MRRSAEPCDGMSAGVADRHSRVADLADDLYIRRRMRRLHRSGPAAATALFCMILICASVIGDTTPAMKILTIGLGLAVLTRTLRTGCSLLTGRRADRDGSTVVAWLLDEVADHHGEYAYRALLHYSTTWPVAPTMRRYLSTLGGAPALIAALHCAPGPDVLTAQAARIARAGGDPGSFLHFSTNHQLSAAAAQHLADDIVHGLTGN